MKLKWSDVANYAAARTVAPRIQAHFARHIAPMSGTRGPAAGRIADVPDLEAIEAIIDAAFWASLRREEGYVPKISLAFLPPEHTAQPLVFERPLPLAAGPLVRVAPAFEHPGVHLGVWRDSA